MSVSLGGPGESVDAASVSATVHVTEGGELRLAQMARLASVGAFEHHVEHGVSADRPVYTRAKRLFDVLFAVMALVLAGPLMLAAAAVILLTSPGPVLFRQVRCGQHGTRFRCLKFRTMVPDAQRLLAHDLGLRAAFGAAWKLHDAPRVTRAGHWLRRTSVDELPQLVSVLRGEMSLVGPRPVQPGELEE